jgi:hypothetical protein
MTVDAAVTGELLRALATHHNHGDGWVYTRDTGDLEHIRYHRDYTGYHAPLPRLKRAFNPKSLFSRGSFSTSLGLKWSLMSAAAWIQVSLQKDRNLPDGALNRGLVLTVWEEDGEYIEMVGPTIGEKIADFLEQDPENPHAQAIAVEILRVQDLRPASSIID